MNALETGIKWGGNGRGGATQARKKMLQSGDREEVSVNGGGNTRLTQDENYGMKGGHWLGEK